MCVWEGVHRATCSGVRPRLGCAKRGAAWHAHRRRQTRRAPRPKRARRGPTSPQLQEEESRAHMCGRCQHRPAATGRHPRRNTGPALLPPPWAPLLTGAHDAHAAASSPRPGLEDHRVPGLGSKDLGSRRALQGIVGAGDDRHAARLRQAPRRRLVAHCLWAGGWVRWVWRGLGRGGQRRGPAVPCCMRHSSPT